jgi:hypothetical protein
VPNDDADADQPDVHHWNWHTEPRDLVVKDQVEGMTSQEALYYVPGDVALGLGYKKPGSQVPMVVAYRWPATTIEQKRTEVEQLRMAMMESQGDRNARFAAMKAHQKAREELREMEEARGPQVLWSAVVPGVDPLTVRLSAPDPEHVAINAEHAAVVYETRDTHRFRVTAFRMTDGTRLWDVALPGDRPMSSVAASPTHVLVSRWDGVTAIDFATGERSFTID